MSIEKAIEILKANGYEIIQHEGWGGYEIFLNGESMNYGATTMEEEDVVDFVDTCMS